MKGKRIHRAQNILLCHAVNMQFKEIMHARFYMGVCWGGPAAITVTAVFTKLHIGFIFKLQKLDLKGKFLFLSQ